MSESISRWQAIILGIVVLSSVAAASLGLSAIAAKQGLWNESFEVTVAFSETHDVLPGTAVRIRGVDAGQVLRVEYPESDGPDAMVKLRLRLDSRYRDRLYADATAQIQSTGLLGAKVIAIQPGSPGSGASSGQLKAVKTSDMAAAAEKLASAAEDIETLVKGIREGKGTLGKLTRDDQIYNDVRGLVQDARTVSRKADAELTNLGPLMQESRAAVQSVQRSTESFERSRFGRQFIENPTAMLVRPDCRQESYLYNTQDLFEPDSAILKELGRWHLRTMVEWIRGLPNDRSEIVVAAVTDEQSARHSYSTAGELSRKQAEAVAEFLKSEKAHRLSWWSRRKVSSIGLAYGPNPALEAGREAPPSYVQVLRFIPQS